MFKSISTAFPPQIFPWISSVTSVVIQQVAWGSSMSPEALCSPHANRLHVPLIYRPSGTQSLVSGTLTWALIGTVMSTAPFLVSLLWPLIHSPHCSLPWWPFKRMSHCFSLVAFEAWPAPPLSVSGTRLTSLTASLHFICHECQLRTTSQPPLFTESTSVHSTAIPYSLRVSCGFTGVTAEMQNLVHRRIYPFLLMVVVLMAVLSFQVRQFKRLYEHIKNDK